MLIKKRSSAAAEKTFDIRRELGAQSTLGGKSIYGSAHNKSHSMPECGTVHGRGSGMSDKYDIYDDNPPCIQKIDLLITAAIGRTRNKSANILNSRKPYRRLHSS